MSRHGIRGVGGSKDVSAWLRQLSRAEGIEIGHHGDRNTHWEITLNGKVIATVAASGSHRSFANAKSHVARAMRMEAQS